jgi:GrpB-like predicted nucleotidyltransferase (UPF0157 family)
MITAKDLRAKIIRYFFVYVLAFVAPVQLLVYLLSFLRHNYNIENSGFKFSPCQIDSMKQAVIVRPYDPRLPGYFKTEKKFLSKTLGRSFSIEHVGSSAVPGLGGKNVLDIQVLAPDKRTATRAIQIIKCLGYTHVAKGAGDAYRIFFNKDKYFGRRKQHIHLHLMWKTANRYKPYLFFRDHLRKHPEEAKRYFSLKKVWARKAGPERLKYKYAKTDYVNSVVRKARHELRH